MDLLRAEHRVGKRHRSPQTRTKLEEPRCAAGGKGERKGESVSLGRAGDAPAKGLRGRGPRSRV